MFDNNQNLSQISANGSFLSPAKDEVDGLSTLLVNQKNTDLVTLLGKRQQADKFLDLIVYWRRPVADLRRALDAISDWGPFEFIGVLPLAKASDGTLRAFCRFHYHGSKSDREHAECNLKALLKPLADWEDAFLAR